MAYATQYCSRCKKDTQHSRVADKRYPESIYLVCLPCGAYRQKQYRQRHPFRNIAAHANMRKRSGSEVITEELIQELWDSQGGKCALTGQEMILGDKWFLPSLDRIDPSKGYCVGNIRLTCWIVNHTKGELTDAEYIKMCTAVTLHNNVMLVGVL
jgi:hypothetical protein